MESEISNFIKVWVLVLISLCYSYKIGKIIQKGPLRLIFLFPIISLFLYLPLNIYSLHLRGQTAFFVAFLGTFKLLLFSFDKGPLSSSSSSNSKPISLSLFIAVSCLPIRISKTLSNKRSTTNVSPTKLILLVLLIKVYEHANIFQPMVILCIIYLILETILASLAAVARAWLGLELEPHFDKPYRSTSLRDFWGKRWNLVVSSILREAVYEPALGFFSSYVVRRKWAPLPAGMSTFLVSGLMHELVLYYLGRVWSNNLEMSCFFVLHGFCWCVEIGIKKLSFGENLRFPRLVCEGLTLGFVIITALWLFVPSFLRVQFGVRMVEDFAAIGGFLRNVTHFLIY